MIELIIFGVLIAAELILAIALAADEISFRKKLHKKSTKKENQDEQG